MNFDILIVYYKKWEVSVTFDFFISKISFYFVSSKTSDGLIQCDSNFLENSLKIIKKVQFDHFVNNLKNFE